MREQVIDNDAEKCRGCTIKHLSEVLVALGDTDTSELIRNAYICGNLAHAANHFVHYSPKIAEKIRELRLDCINNDLTLALPLTEIGQRLSDIIEQVAKYKEPVKSVDTKVNTGALMTKPGTGGCRCRKGL